MHNGGHTPELREVAVDLFTQGADVIAGNMMPNGTRLTGLRPICVNAGKAPNAYLNEPNVLENEENNVTMEDEDHNVAIGDDDQNDVMAPENADDDQAEVMGTDPNDAGRDQPALPTGQPAPRMLEVEVRTIDFDVRATNQWYSPDICN